MRRSLSNLFEGSGWTVLSILMIFPIFIQFPNFTIFLNSGDYLYYVEGHLVPLGFLVFLSFFLLSVFVTVRRDGLAAVLIPLGVTFLVLLLFFSESLETPIGNLQAVALPLLCVWTAFARVSLNVSAFALGLFCLPVLHFVSFFDLSDPLYAHRIDQYSFIFGYQVYSGLVAYVDVYGVIAAYFLIMFFWGEGRLKIVYYWCMLAVLIIMYYSGQRVVLIYQFLMFAAHVLFAIRFAKDGALRRHLTYVLLHFVVVAFFGFGVGTELGTFFPYVFFSIFQNLAYLSALAVDEQLISSAVHEGFWSLFDRLLGTRFLEGVMFHNADPRISLYGSMLEDMFEARGGATGWTEGGAGYHNLIGGLVVAYGWPQFFLYCICIVASVFMVSPNKSVLFFVLLLFALPNLVNVPASQPVYIVAFCMFLTALRTIKPVHEPEGVK